MNDPENRAINLERQYTSNSMEFVNIAQSELVHFRNLEAQKKLRDKTIRYGNLLKFFGMTLFIFSLLALLQSVILIIYSEPGSETRETEVTTQSTFISFLRNSISPHNYYVSDGKGILLEFNKQEANFNNFLSLFVDIFVILISIKMIRVTAVVSDVLE